MTNHDEPRTPGRDDPRGQEGYGGWRAPFPQDNDLSPDARAYVLSLRSVDARNDARDYARMDEQLFRARIGPAIDEVLAEVKRLQRPVTKRQIAGILAAGGLVAEAIVRGLERFR